MKYSVKRPHQGDKWYDVGDTREANPNSVAHLLASGTLVDPSDDESEAQSDGGAGETGGEKSETTVENKSDKPTSNKAQDPENSKAS